MYEPKSETFGQGMLDEINRILATRVEGWEQHVLTLTDSLRGNLDAGTNARAAFCVAAGTAFISRREYGKAFAVMREAFGLAAQAPDTDAALTLNAGHGLAVSLVWLGDYDGARMTVAKLRKSLVLSPEARAMPDSMHMQLCIIEASIDALTAARRAHAC